MSKFSQRTRICATCMLGFIPVTASADPLVPTAFTYQGQLRFNGAEVNTECNFQFCLWDAPTGGGQLGCVTPSGPVQLLDGRFTVVLDFGDVFDGNMRWLEISVNCLGDPEDTVIAPRQELTTAPYAGFSSKPWETNTKTQAVSYTQGYVGIGTTTPLRRLHVVDEGGILIDRTAINGDAQLAFSRSDGAGDPSMYLTYWGVEDANTLAMTNIFGHGVHVHTNGNATVGNFNSANFGGSARLAVMDGNVGIGTTNPTAKLHVVGSAIRIEDSEGFASILRPDGFSHALRLGNGNHVSYGGWDFRNSDGSQSTMVVDPGSGNVGIGTASPQHALQVGGPTSDAQTVGVRAFSNTSWSGAFGSSVATVVLGANKNGVAEIGGNNSTLSAWSTLAINSGGGNVGIGTTSPERKLHVAGDFTAALGASEVFLSAGGGFVELNGPQPFIDFHFGNNAGDYDTRVINDLDNRLAIMNNAQGMFAFHNDHFGVGTLTPEVPLQILGGSALTLSGGGHLQIGPTTNNNIIIDHNDIQRRQNGQPAELILNRYGGRVGIGLDAPAAILHVDGNARVDGNITVQSCTGCSDRRFKSEVTGLSNGLETIAKLQGVRFRWRQQEFPERNFPEGPQIGFIAQDVQETLPEVVVEDEDGSLSLDYGRLTALLVEGIKEQQAMLEEACKENRDLTVRMAELEGIVARLSRESDSRR